jgi:nucleoside-diphosphate-sugar epimerase
MAETPAPSKSVFLTGASGALGRAVARQLIDAGYRVTAAVNGYRSALALRQTGAVAAFPDVRRAGEVRSAITGAGATVVVHLEPMLPNHTPNLDPHWDSQLDMIRESAAAVAQAAADAGVEFLVSTSYAFVYGNTGREVASEDSAPHGPNLPVIQAALDAESAVLNGSVPACVLRAGYVYGAHDEQTTALRDRLLKGEAVLVGDAHAVANWVMVDDLAAAIVAAIETRPAGAILNIVDNTPVSPAAFAGYLGEVMHVPVSARTAGGGLLAKLKAPPTEPALIDLQTRASNARAAEVLGWTPRYPSYREGLEQALLTLRAEEPVS